MSAPSFMLSVSSREGVLDLARTFLGDRACEALAADLAGVEYDTSVKARTEALTAPYRDAGRPPAPSDTLALLCFSACAEVWSAAKPEVYDLILDLYMQVDHYTDDPSVLKLNKAAFLIVGVGGMLEVLCDAGLVVGQVADAIAARTSMLPPEVRPAYVDLCTSVSAYEAKHGRDPELWRHFRLLNDSQLRSHLVPKTADLPTLLDLAANKGRDLSRIMTYGMGSAAATEARLPIGAACQVIDDVMDAREDREAGITTFATLSGVTRADLMDAVAPLLHEAVDAALAIDQPEDVKASALYAWLTEGGPEEVRGRVVRAFSILVDKSWAD